MTKKGISILTAILLSLLLEGSISPQEKTTDVVGKVFLDLSFDKRAELIVGNKGLMLLFYGKSNFADDAAFALNIEQRRLVAKSLYDDARTLNRSIRNISPKEEEWLDKEIKSRNTDRFLKAMNSIEYQMREVKVMTNSLENTLKFLINSIGVDLNREMGFWIFLIYTINLDKIYEGVWHLAREKETDYTGIFHPTAILDISQNVALRILGPHFQELQRQDIKFKK